MTDDNTQPLTLLWLRKDLRFDDHPALTAAAKAGAVAPVFILDDVLESELGGAARLRLREALSAFAIAAENAGSPLILRRGDPRSVLAGLAEETGARAVRWTRLTDGPSLRRDEAVKAELKAAGLEVESHGGFTLQDPWAISTGAGDQYKVYSPFMKALAASDIPAPLPPVESLDPPVAPISSDHLSDWRLDAAMGPAAAALAGRIKAGEAAAQAELDRFAEGRATAYRDMRDRLDLRGTSGFSDYLAWGELSPRRVYHRLAEVSGGFAVQRQIGWRDFAHHLLFHDPEMERLSWRREWEAYPWRADNDDAEAWRRGETGCDVVDAAMRELWVTGRMHNRARMLVASYLTKNLMTHWRVGEAHFRETLIDWDPANNAMGWQWTAGCGPDAAPFFRIFNPETQAEKFDPQGAYRRRWLSGEGAEAFAAMRPASEPAPKPRARVRPLVDLKETRAAALAAWNEMKDGGKAA